MMIRFPARGDDSEEQRKRLQQSPPCSGHWETLHSPSSYQIVARVITAEVPSCSLVRNTALVQACPPTRLQWTRGLFNTTLNIQTELKVLA